MHMTIKCVAIIFYDETLTNFVVDDILTRLQIFKYVFQIYLTTHQPGPTKGKVSYNFKSGSIPRHFEYIEYSL